MSHRIVSYNILSSHLADPEHFPSCDPVHLDANNRLEKILVKLTPNINKEDGWTPEISQPLRSAYATYQGKEPKFTNYAQVRKNPVFIETLDYIWLSQAWQVNSVLPLPGLKEVDGPFPNEIEPSDHIAIAAELTHEHSK